MTSAGPSRMLGAALVEPLGLGCMSFAGFYGETDRDASFATLARAAELGINHLDTAIRYGEGLSESIIGEFCANHDNSFVIASKAGLQLREDGTRQFNNKRDYLRRSVEESLGRLRTDRIELYYLHRLDPEVPIEDAMAYMAEFVDEGLIGGIGLSEIAPATLERAVTVHPVAAVQSEYSLWSRLPDLGMIDACARHGATFVSFSPVGRGAITDSPPDPATMADDDFRKANPRFNAENYPANLAHIQRLREYAASRGWSTSALAIAWVLARASHVVTIPGTRTPEHLDDLATARDIVLGEQELSDINAILPAGFAHGPRYSPAQTGGTQSYA